MSTTPIRAQSEIADLQLAERFAAVQAWLCVATVQGRCRTAGKADEIVVCVDRGEDLRVPSTAESGPY